MAYISKIQLPDGTIYDIKSNTGVLSITSGSTYGTINVNTGGTIASIPVYGLGSAAYTASTSYATATQGAIAEAAMSKSGGTFTGSVTLSGTPTLDLHAATKKYVDDNVSISGTLGSGTEIGTITIGSTSTTLYAPSAPTTISVTQSASTPTLEFVVGTNIASSASLTGVLADTAPIANGKIVYYLCAYALPNTEQTLTLTYGSTGTNTGAIPLYINSTSRAITPYPAGTILILAYYDSKFYVLNNTQGVVTGSSTSGLRYQSSEDTLW